MLICLPCILESWDVFIYLFIYGDIPICLSYLYSYFSVLFLDRGILILSFALENLDSSVFDLLAVREYNLFIFFSCIHFLRQYVSFILHS